MPRNRVFLLLLTGLVAASTTHAAAAEPARPNILLIMADDLGFSDLGCYGGEIPTPNVDRLAADGLRFTQFYTCAVCGTTRAALLTGLYHHQVGIRQWNGTMRPGGITVAEALKLRGYHTMMVGKWDGNVLARHRGFDRFFGFNTLGTINYFKEVRTAPFYDELQRYKLPEEDFYVTDALTDRAVAMLREAASRDEPFFLYAAYVAPHWPLQAKEEDIAHFRALYREQGWDAIRQQRHVWQVEMGLVNPKWKLPPRDPAVPPWDKEEHKAWQAERMAVYAAQVHQLDRNVGRLLSVLDESGKANETLVIFLSDNGASPQSGPGSAYFNGRKPWRLDGQPIRAGNNPAIMPGGDDTFSSYGPHWARVSTTPLNGYKIESYEGGIATPLVIRWPAHVKARGAITHQVGHVMDFMATFLDVAGVEYPKEYGGHMILPLEGKSLLPVLEGGERAGYDALFWEFAGNRAVRVGPWKAVSPKGKRWELYQMEEDRTETNNLARSEPERTKELANRWMQWAERVGIAKEFTAGP